MILSKAVLRLLAQARARVLAVVLLIATSVIVYAGTWMGLGQVAETTARIYADLRMYDAEVRIEPVRRGLVPDPRRLEADVPALTAVDWRLVAPARLRLADGAGAAGVLLVGEGTRRATVADVLVVEGDWLDAADTRGVVVDRTFALDNGLEPGEEFDLRSGPYESRVHVRGVGIFPELLMASVDDHLTAPVRGSIAGIFVAEPLLLGLRAAEDPLSVTRNAGDFSLVNSVAFQVGDDREKAIEAVTRALRDAGLKVTAVTRREDQYSVWCNANRLATCVDFLPAAVVIYDAVAAGVIVLMLRRLLEQWRRELGALRAVGYGSSEILGAWLAASGSFYLIGCGFGAVGSYLLAMAVAPAYMESTGFPIVLAELHPAPILEACVLAALVVFPAVTLPVALALRTPPAELLRAQGEVLGGGAPLRLALRLDERGRRWLGEPERVGLRNVWRRPGATFGAAAALAGTLVMAASMYLFAEGTDRGLKSFLAAERWDALVTFDTPSAEPAALLARAGPALVEPFSTMGVTIGAGGAVRSTELVAMALPSELRGDQGLVRGRMPRAVGEIVIDLRLALQLGVTEGSRVDVSTEGANVVGSVVGIANAWTINQAFVTPDTLSAWGGDPTRAAGALLRGDEAMVQALYEVQGVARVLPGARVRATADATNELLAMFIWLYGHFGAITGLVLAGSTMQLAVVARRSEFALLRGLGYRRSEVARVLLAESLGIALLAGVAALPAVWATTAVFQERIMHISVWVPVDRSVGAAAMVVTPAALLLVGSVLPALREVYRGELSAPFRARIG